MNRINKILIVFVLLAKVMFAQSPVQTVLMSQVVPKGYESDVFKKTIVLMTEARLYLQKKYKKKVIFEYIDKKLTKKDEIAKVLKKNNYRFYVYLKIKKKKAKKNLEKVLYSLVIFDIKKNRSKTVKTKAIIRDKKIVKISQGDLKSSAKKIAKILKKR